MTTGDHLKQAEWVEWIDHAGSGGWQETAKAEETNLGRCHSLGFVVYEDEERIVLAQSVDIEFSNTDNRVAIAKKLIVGRWPIR